MKLLKPRQQSSLYLLESTRTAQNREVPRSGQAKHKPCINVFNLGAPPAAVSPGLSYPEPESREKE